MPVQAPSTNAVAPLVFCILGIVGSFFYGAGICFATGGLILANGALAITTQVPNHPDAGVLLKPLRFALGGHWILHCSDFAHRGCRCLCLNVIACRTRTGRRLTSCGRERNHSSSNGSNSSSAASSMWPTSSRWESKSGSVCFHPPGNLVLSSMILSMRSCQALGLRCMM